MSYIYYLLAYLIIYIYLSLIVDYYPTVRIKIYAQNGSEGMSFV